MLQVKLRLAALALVIADHRHQRAAVVDAGGVVKEAVPIIALGAAIDEVAGHHVEGGIGPGTKRVVNRKETIIQLKGSPYFYLPNEFNALLMSL